MRGYILLLGVAALASGIASVVGAAGKMFGPPLSASSGSPVAVELFTSQGCSSCPPADALFSRLSADPSIIVITRPVTYWDNLGWKDSLAREDNTKLQRAYAARGGEGSGVYTPQAVVQGSAGVVGSNEREIRALIASARSISGPAVALTQTPGGGHVITMNGRPAHLATITIIALRSSATVRIGRGENGGRTVRYTNVFVGEHSLGTWAGGLGQYTVSADVLHKAGADRAALLVRLGSSGPIIAARYL
jgi:hypothetical protein